MSEPSSGAHRQQVPASSSPGHQQDRPPEPKPPRGKRRWLVPTIVGVVALSAGVGIGASGNSSKATVAAGPTVTETVAGAIVTHDVTQPPVTFQPPAVTVTYTPPVDGSGSGDGGDGDDSDQPQKFGTVLVWDAGYTIKVVAKDGGAADSSAAGASAGAHLAAVTVTIKNTGSKTLDASSFQTSATYGADGSSAPQVFDGSYDSLDFEQVVAPGRSVTQTGAFAAPAGKDVVVEVDPEDETSGTDLVGQWAGVVR